MENDGRAPIIGDSDSGQVLPIVRRGANDHAYVLALGAAIFKEPRFGTHASGVYCQSDLTRSLEPSKIQTIQDSKAKSFGFRIWNLKFEIPGGFERRAYLVFRDRFQIDFKSQV